MLLSRRRESHGNTQAAKGALMPLRGLPGSLWPGRLSSAPGLYLGLTLQQAQYEEDGHFPSSPLVDNLQKTLSMKKTERRALTSQTGAASLAHGQEPLVLLPRTEDKKGRSQCGELTSTQNQDPGVSIWPVADGMPLSYASFLSITTGEL